jgi:hypothetical protein
VDERVAVDDRLVLSPEVLQREPVDDHVVGANHQAIQRALHRHRGRAQDVPPVDLAHRSRADADARSHSTDAIEQLETLFHAEHLRVVRALDERAFGQNDRGGHHGSGERTPADLVDTGHGTTAAPELPLVLEHVPGPLRLLRFRLHRRRRVTALAAVPRASP